MQGAGEKGVRRTVFGLPPLTRGIDSAVCRERATGSSFSEDYLEPNSHHLFFYSHEFFHSNGMISLWRTETTSILAQFLTQRLDHVPWRADVSEGAGFSANVQKKPSTHQSKLSFLNSWWRRDLLLAAKGRATQPAPVPVSWSLARPCSWSHLSELPKVGRQR